MTLSCSGGVRVFLPIRSRTYEDSSSAPGRFWDMEIVSCRLEGSTRAASYRPSTPGNQQPAHHERRRRLRAQDQRLLQRRLARGRRREEEHARAENVERAAPGGDGGGGVAARDPVGPALIGPAL